MSQKFDLNRNLHVLIIDDQEPSRVLSRFALMDLGFKNIHEMSNGLHAMEYVALAYKSGKPVDLILCDHEMPEVDGFQFYRILSESRECRNIPFIMVTSHSEPELVADMATHGIKNFIVKPISPQQLGEKMMKMLMKP